MIRKRRPIFPGLLFLHGDIDPYNAIKYSFDGVYPYMVMV